MSDAFDPFTVRIASLTKIRQAVGTAEFRSNVLLSGWLRVARFILDPITFDRWRSECKDWNVNRRRCLRSLALYIAEDTPLSVKGIQGELVYVDRASIERALKFNIRVGFPLDQSDFDLLKLALWIRINTEKSRRVPT